jgi:RHS repeat-associated protein
MNEAEYRRLLKILTVRACRALRVAASKGEDWVLAESGKSPADYAAEALIRWGTNQLQFTGTPEALVAYLTKVMTNAIVSTLRKREVKTSRGGKTTLADELTEDSSPQSKPESLFDFRALLRDGAFREALNQCTADDEALKEYVLAIEMFEDTIPAARDVASPLWAHSNVFSAGRLSATYDLKGLHLELADPLGTKRVQVNAAGQIDETCTSLPFGNDVGNPLGANCSTVANALGTADDATEHHFTQKERDTESGNDYFFARYYTGSLGRFTSPDWSAKTDPVPYAVFADPQSLNLYAYVRNNPILNLDLNGHCNPNDWGCNKWDVDYGKMTHVFNVKYFWGTGQDAKWRSAQIAIHGDAVFAIPGGGSEGQATYSKDEAKQIAHTVGTMLDAAKGFNLTGSEVSSERLLIGVAARESDFGLNPGTSDNPMQATPARSAKEFNNDKTAMRTLEKAGDRANWVPRDTYDLYNRGPNTKNWVPNSPNSNADIFERIYESMKDTN